MEEDKYKARKAAKETASSSTGAKRQSASSSSDAPMAANPDNAETPTSKSRRVEPVPEEEADDSEETEEQIYPL